MKSLVVAIIVGLCTFASAVELVLCRHQSRRLFVELQSLHEVKQGLDQEWGQLLLEQATWGAELAMGDGPGRIYIVEPTGPIEDDPNLTDQKFPGNPTRSFRTRAPLRVTGEVNDWEGHAPEPLQTMKDGLAQLAAQGIEAIED